jgi:hypothetical protein
MSTDLHRRPSGDRLDRLVAWILDPDGVMYGDERERLRFYESSTVVASLHGILVPWTLVVCALLGGRAVAPVVGTVAAVFLAPWIIGSLYVRRRRVRTTPSPFTSTWIVTALLAWLPYPLLLLVVALQFAQGSSSGFARGFLGGAIGGVAGCTLAIAVTLARKARADRRPGAAGNAAQDAADDDE